MRDLVKNPGVIEPTHKIYPAFVQSLLNIVVIGRDDVSPSKNTGGQEADENTR